MCVTHVGGYDSMSKTHQALWQYMEVHEIEGGFPIWEIYIDDPGEVAEDKLRTEICRTIA